MKWKLPLVALVVLVGGAYLYLADGRRPASPQASGGSTTPPLTAPAVTLPTAGHGHDAPASPGAPSAVARPPSALSAPLNAQARAAVQEFDRLRDLPPGDAAIELGRQIEAAITKDNVAGYVQVLLKTDHPAVERSAIAALARAADSPVMLALAGQYGAVAPESRGRILQVLEGAANPAAVEGLAAIYAADLSEKRSPLVMSALHGLANIGTMESVQYLLSQVSPGNAEYALLAMERVRTTQGIEMIRAAAEGSKDAEAIAPAFRPALRRIAEAAAKP
jgi:hypothetical protein